MANYSREEMELGLDRLCALLGCKSCVVRREGCPLADWGVYIII